MHGSIHAIGQGARLVRAPRWVAALVAGLAAVQIGSLFFPPHWMLEPLAHYLAAHSVLEAVSIFASMVVFAVCLNERTSRGSDNLHVLAVVFLAVAAFDLFHVLTYVGMPAVLTVNGPDKHLNFWLAARLIAALGLLIIALRPWDRPLRPWVRVGALPGTFLLMLAFTGIVLQFPDWTPRWFLPGSGLTWAKKLIEFAIIGIHVSTIILLRRPQFQNDRIDRNILCAAMIIMIMSGIFFTQYSIMNGWINVFGHIYKAVAYLMIYQSIARVNLERPFHEISKIQDELDMAVEASNTGLWSFAPERDAFDMSPVLKAQLGYQPHEISNSTGAWLALVHPDDRQRVLTQFQDHAGKPSGARLEAEFRMQHRSGEERWVLARGRLQVDPSGERRIIGSLTDLSERHREESRFRSAVEAAPTAMIMVDGDGHIVLANGRADQLFGYPTGSLRGQPLRMLVPSAMTDAHEALRKDFMRAPADRGMGPEREIYAQHSDGHLFRVEIGLTLVSGEQGKFVLASITDLTSRIEAEAQINRLINFDILTGLPNRKQVKAYVNDVLLKGPVHRAPIAIAVLDLDNFKYINDTLGHSVGDQLLIKTAERLAKIIPVGAMAARLSGDEFIVLLPDGTDAAIVRDASRIQAEMAKPYVLDGSSVVLTVSIGIASSATDGSDFDTLVQHADIAMYRAKDEGRNSFKFFARDMNLRTARLFQLESALHTALANEQFSLVYQPQFGADHGQIVGVEALLRWQHPELGPVSPAEFIPLAERNGTILAIGEFVLRTAVKELSQWSAQGLPSITLAVNLSAAQFRQRSLHTQIAAILDAHAMPARQLELELTESVAMADPAQAVDIMNDLNAIGVRLAIDDFGTGYSSLNYLKRFNAHKLKIDQSFVQDINHDLEDQAIVRSIVALAHNLGFTTIAEGVELPEQRDCLKAIGCDAFQGFLLARPMTAEALRAFVLAHGARDFVMASAGPTK